MSNKNNKFWQKDSKVVPISDDADLENTTKDSIEEAITNLEEGNVGVEVKPLVTFTAAEVSALVTVAKQDALTEMLKMLKEHRFNQIDNATCTRMDADKVGEWLEMKLKKDGKI